MKWDSSVKQPDGTRIRTAQFQDHHEAHIVTDYDGKRVTVHRLGDDFDLAEATPCHGMDKTADGKRRYRRWLVKVSTPGHKYGFVTVGGKDRAIQLMLNDSERQYYQGRPMGL